MTGDAHPRPVGATYRLQVGPDLDLHAAAQLVDYLADLGVTHLYCSPLLQARPGSPHGYDVADPTRVDEARGGEDGLRALARTAHDAGLGIVLDIVPNHLGTGFSTPWWRALLEHGQAGPHGSTFDVDWQTPTPGAGGKVLVPVLGDQYGVVLARSELQVVTEDAATVLAYHEHRFPLSPESVDAVGRAGGPEAFVASDTDPGARTRLHALLEAQHYRLVHWRAPLVNYRRFFSVDELAGVRVEDESVFDAVHERVVHLVRDGVVDGLRVDHPDGLRDPRRYLERLSRATGGVWTVVEKITAPGESLPQDWRCDGTTGYDALNDILGLFVDPDTEAPSRVAARFEARLGDPDVVVVAAKAEVLDTELRPELLRIARLLWALTGDHPEVRDCDERECSEVLADVAAGFDVYRTYVDPETGAASAEDRTRIARAVAAGRRAGRAPAHLYGFCEQVLVGALHDEPLAREVAARLPQLSGALTAKGVEDTVLYRHRELPAVNEVGGDPWQRGVDLETFHARAAARSRTAMVTTATHDTKRGEDARLRIAALSEVGDVYESAVPQWLAVLADQRPEALRGLEGPTLLLAFQTMVAVRPWDTSSVDMAPYRSRVTDYLVKAEREAGTYTSWRDPDPVFEEAIVRVVAATDEVELAGLLVSAVIGTVREIAVASGLSQVLLRCTVPGVPDTYQGTERWDLSLVDPDNRRPVDWADRRALLAEVRDAEAAELFARRHDGAVKAFVLNRALRARRDHPAAFGPSAQYAPMRARGAWAPHVVAFARSSANGDDRLVTVATRLPGRVALSGETVLDSSANQPVGPKWDNTELDLGPGTCTDLLTGARHPGGPAPVRAVLSVLPVALLRRES